MPLSLVNFLEEFGVKTEEELFKKRTTDKVVKAMSFAEAPRRVEMTADQCKKLCDKNGLRYHPGYESRVIERVTTTEAPDRYGDIVRAKGIDNANYRKNAVVLFAHNHGDFPVGKSIKEWIDNTINGWRSWDLYFGDELDSTGKSDLTFRMVDSGAMPAGSIGFMPGTSKADHTPEERGKIGLGKYGVEYLTCEKLEHSACSVPANPEALSNCLKSIEEKRFKSMFAQSDIDRLVAEKMLGNELADVFAAVLGVKRVYSIPTLAPAPVPELEAKEIVLRPYPSEHAARVRDPKDFQEDSFRRKNVTEGVDIITGKLTDGDDTMVAQAYRFDADTFTPGQAKKWLKEEDVSYISFEPATAKYLPDTEINLNIDFSQVHTEFDNLTKKMHEVNSNLELLLKSCEEKTSNLIAATQRALAVLETKSKSTSLYDKKELEKALMI